MKEYQILSLQPKFQADRCNYHWIMLFFSMLTQSGAWFWPGRFIGETAISNNLSNINDNDGAFSYLKFWVHFLTKNLRSVFQKFNSLFFDIECRVKTWDKKGVRRRMNNNSTRKNGTTCFAYFCWTERLNHRKFMTIWKLCKRSFKRQVAGHSGFIRLEMALEWVKTLPHSILCLFE